MKLSKHLAAIKRNGRWFAVLRNSGMVITEGHSTSSVVEQLAERDIGLMRQYGYFADALEVAQSGIPLKHFLASWESTLDHIRGIQTQEKWLYPKDGLGDSETSQELLERFE